MISPYLGCWPSSISEHDSLTLLCLTVGSGPKLSQSCSVPPGKNIKYKELNSSQREVERVRNTNTNFLKRKKRDFSSQPRHNNFP